MLYWAAGGDEPMFGHGVTPPEPAAGVVADGVVDDGVIDDGVVVVTAAVVPPALEEPVAACVISAAPPATAPATARVSRTFRSGICIALASVLSIGDASQANRTRL